MATAVISMVTAVGLWPLIPKALEHPIGEAAAVGIESLEAEVSKRRTCRGPLGRAAADLALTLASIGAGFIATDRAGRVTRMNAVAEQVTGWPQDEALGRSLWDVFVREDRPPEYLRA